MINTLDLVETLLQADEPVARMKVGEPRTLSRFGIRKTATEIVNRLLEAQPIGGVPVVEASVHRFNRSRIWQAVFTSPSGGQVWRTTGLTNRDQALLVAKDWESKARTERAKGRTPRKPMLRVRRSEPGFGPPLLSQREVARLLHMSERGVREAERRAFQKLRNHPLLKQVWRQYVRGELDEEHFLLTQDEVEALFNLARTPEEQHLIQKVLALIHG